MLSLDKARCYWLVLLVREHGRRRTGCAICSYLQYGGRSGADKKRNQRTKKPTCGVSYRVSLEVYERNKRVAVANHTGWPVDHSPSPSSRVRWPLRGWLLIRSQHDEATSGSGKRFALRLLHSTYILLLLCTMYYVLRTTYVRRRNLLVVSAAQALQTTPSSNCALPNRRASLDTASSTVKISSACC